MIDRPLNILYFSNEPVRGGVEEHILLLLRGLDRNRFRPHLVCHPELVPKLQPDLPGDVDVLPLYFEHPNQLAPALRFAQVLRKCRVDILHSHLFRASLVASPIGWLCRVPLILETPHVRELWRSGWLKGHFLSDRIAGRFVHRYIAVSEANARYLIETKGLPAAKVTAIPNGCDLQRFDPAHQPPTNLKTSLGFAETDPVLVVLARLEPQKGHRILIDAMSTIRTQFPSVRLVCVGSGSLQGELKSQAHRVGLEDSIRFVGFQSNVQDWLALADVSILPSFYEGLPLVAIESLAAERAVVATAVDGTPEVIVHGKTGLTVPPGDPAALAAAICRLLREPELRQNLARQGRTWALGNFTLQRFLERTQQFYLSSWEERVLKTPSPRKLSIPSASDAVPDRSSSW